jgi:hypothetical protein
MSRQQNSGQYQNIPTVNRSSGNVVKFKYVGMIVSNLYCNHEELKKKLIWGNDCYYSVQNRSSSHLVSKKVKIKIYKAVILPIVLTWALTLRKEHEMQMFDTRDEVTGYWRELHNEELHNLYSSANIIMIKSKWTKWAGHVTDDGN